MTTRRIALRVILAGNRFRAVRGLNSTAGRRLHAPRDVASSGCILLQELDGVPDRQDGLRRIVGNLAAEFFLEGHDQLDSVEAVGPKVVDEARVLGDLVRLDSEMLHHDLFYALRDIAHIRLTRP